MQSLQTPTVSRPARLLYRIMGLCVAIPVAGFTTVLLGYKLPIWILEWRRTDPLNSGSPLTIIVMFMTIPTAFILSMVFLVRITRSISEKLVGADIAAQRREK